MMTVGRCAVVRLVPCPPGIPLIMPGEVVTIDCKEALRIAKSRYSDSCLTKKPA